MKLYNEAKENCKYGHFDMEKQAGYVLTDGNKLTEPWYYVYTNRKILLYVDQNGPVKMQYEPPSGCLLLSANLGKRKANGRYGCKVSKSTTAYQLAISTRLGFVWIKKSRKCRWNGRRKRRYIRFVLKTRISSRKSSYRAIKRRYV